MQLTWLLIITVAAAAFAIYDGVTRLRGRRSNSIIAIAELVFSVLMLAAIFIHFPAPLGVLFFAVGLEVVLILLLVLRGTGRRRFSIITLVALILNSIVVLIAWGVLHVPGIG
ncbi:MAG: hypothetical protein EPN91_00420 [Salinibacterium sp.]|nr:MAG: hypothetical protein EPN91_00420 [Salinibacterium sp.]